MQSTAKQRAAAVASTSARRTSYATSHTRSHTGINNRDSNPEHRSLTSAGASTAGLYALPVQLESSYVARYRNPRSFDQDRYSQQQPQPQSSNYAQPSQRHQLPSQSYAPSLTSRKPSNVIPSKNREEMESRWVPPDPAIDTNKPLSQSAGHSSSSSKPVKTALLTPGSGSQYVGMGSFLLEDSKAAREVWEEAEESLSTFERWRKDLKLHEMPELQHLDLKNWSVWQKERSASELRQIVMGGPQDELTRSSNMQPAINITTQMFLRTLETDYGTPISRTASFFAGHSSGEYSACVASGIVSFAEGVKLTRLAGLLTSRTLQLSSLKSYSEYTANDEERAQMSALLLHPGSSVQNVQSIVRKTRENNPGNAGMVEIASYNSSHQLILSGSRAGVLNACDQLMSKNIASRAADLPVFAPFHCSFMQLAAIGMAHAWNEGVKAKAPRAPLVSNVDATLVKDAEKLKSHIVTSLHAPVVWTQALDVMRDHGVSRYIFLGPGKALANLAKKECKMGKWKDWSDVQVASVATRQDLEEVAQLCSDSGAQLSYSSAETSPSTL